MIDSTGAEVCAGQPVLHCNITRNDADALGTRKEDLVTKQKVFHLIAEALQFFHHRTCFFDPASGQIIFESTDTVKVRMEATTGC